ncbi:MAG: hypothetical protein H0W62_05430 [Chitinophagales bacterium]|nr:hypothetical protein [Chitinophagales bacterium]
MKGKINKMFSSSVPEITEELFFRYAEGSVSIIEKRSVEERLADDPFLSDALEGLMANRDFSKQRVILKEIRQKVQPRAGERMFKILPFWSIVQIASSMVLIIIMAWFIGYLIKKQNEKIFSEQFKPYSAPFEIVIPPSGNSSERPLSPVKDEKDVRLSPKASIQVQNAGSDIKALLDEALTFYKSGKYAQAIPLFESVLKADRANETAAFYCGISYLTTANADSALQKLVQIDSKVNSVFYEQTLWYEALAYNYKNEKVTSMEKLKKIIGLNGNFKLQAENLLNQLK